MTQPNRTVTASLALLLLLSTGCSGVASPPAALTRDRQRESLEQAVRWKNPSPAAVLQLMGDYLATNRVREGYEFFETRRHEAPDAPLFTAVSGLLQARMASQIPLLRRVAWVDDAIDKLDHAAPGGGLERYLRGLVFAELPTRFKRTEQAVKDLEWVLATPPATFPPGLWRGAWHGLAKAYETLGRAADAASAREKAGGETAARGPLFLLDGSVDATNGYRFTPPALLQPAPGVYVATGFDFADLSFIVTSDGVVAIDAGTTVETAAAALAAFRKVCSLPIRTVIVTHAHWDHIGGLPALLGPGTRVIAQAGYRAELDAVNAGPVPLAYFFGTAAHARPSYVFSPDLLISERQTLTVGDTQIVLVPTHGGETEDALMAFLPARGVLFVGDVFMPYFGAPFVSEGSVDGLLDTIEVIDGLAPKLLLHGHPPLTQNFTVAVLHPLRDALKVTRDAALTGIRNGQPLAQILDQNPLPEVLADHPDAVVPYLLMRDDLTKRLYSQRTGYWKSDGEGIQVYSRPEWAAAINLVGGGRAEAFVEAANSLADRGDNGMSLEIARLGLALHPQEAGLIQAQQRALEALRVQEQFNPFKFIVYSGMAEEGLPAPVR